MACLASVWIMGGLAGMPGENILEREERQVIAGKDTFDVSSGAVVCISTPGGGFLSEEDQDGD